MADLRGIELLREPKLTTDPGDFHELCALSIEREEHLRQRTARFLHDEVAQLLAILKIQIRQLPQPQQTAFQESSALLDRTLDNVRSLAMELRPSLLDDLGLVPAVKWFLRNEPVAGEARLMVGDELPKLGPGAALTCYRTIQLVVRQIGGPIEIAAAPVEGEFHLSVAGRGLVPPAFEAIIPEIRLRTERAGGKLAIVDGLTQGWEFRAQFPRQVNGKSLFA